MEETLGLWLLLAVLQTSNCLVCNSVDARNNVKLLESLRNCTVVEGYVKVVLMEKDVKDEDFEPYSFPELMEVTEYMVFFRVQGLRSLGKMFPNLRKIGGVELMIPELRGGFALVVHEMFSLREIGLVNLREITRGSVAIMKNPNLCFVNTVRWDRITRWNTSEVHNFMQNRDTRDANWHVYDGICPGCPDHCPEGACWNDTHCQFNTETSGCDPLCIGGCFKPGPGGCYTCKGYFDPERNCVNTCPYDTYKLRNWRCVTREECVKTKISGRDYFIHGNQCVDSCPSGLEPDLGLGECRPCQGEGCQKICQGEVISSTSEAEKLRGCTYINGSLHITIKSEMTQAVYSILEESLGSIVQIKGALQVSRSSVTDLNFLKNLMEIQGNETSKKDSHEEQDDPKTIKIMHNNNLQDLWDWKVKTNLTVRKGKVFIHNNPKLCLDRIYKLLDVIGYDKTNISGLEVGEKSNGDKSPCNASRLNVTVVDISYDRIRLNVTHTELLPVLPSVVYFMKDPENNMTMFDDFDQCSNNGWRTIDVHVDDSNDLDYGLGFSVNLTELEPFTHYVFYVVSYSVNSAGARSEMIRVDTLPGTPSAVKNLQAVVNSSCEIELKWEPPKRVNGKLKEYVVSWYELNEDRAFIDQRNYCHNPLVEDHESYKPKKTRPQVKVNKYKNKSCCAIPQKPVLPKDDFEELCNSHVNLPIGFPDITKYPSCKTYFYSFIYKSPFSPSMMSEEKPLLTFKANYINPLSGKKFVRNNKFLTSLNNIPNYDTLIKDIFGLLNNKHKSKIKNLTTHSNEVVLKDLKHFQNYVVSVKACREAHQNESVASHPENRCSISEIIHVRTLGNKEADAIPQEEIKFEYVRELGALHIKWDPPKSPNGFIVAYDIEYRNKYVENSLPETECLTYTECERNNYKYTIHSLSLGHYEIRIRAVTLYGKGPYSTNFFIVPKESDVSLMDIFLLIAAIVAFFVVSSYILSTYKSRPGIVSRTVNPYYDYDYVPDHYEIDRDDIELIEVLGIGSFGKVYKGFWKSEDLICAVKTVNEDATVYNENEFLVEASVMKSMTKSYFIVEIYGVVSRGRPPMVLMELMDHGDLKTYLRNVRETNPITNAVMIKMALEIADGMAYMEAKKFVHRDLAARNCMVSYDLTVKVGDFGMARDIYETDYYRKKDKAFLPIRWMSPESLKDGEYTSQSDVWSYGVVLWEIVTMAEQPYQGYSNDQVLHDVIAGKRLEIPKKSPIPLKSLMEKCWRTVPARRSSFMSIVGFLEYYHDEEFKRVAYYHSKEAVDAREGMWEYVEMNPLLAGRPRPLPSTSYRLATVDEE